MIEYELLTTDDELSTNLLDACEVEKKIENASGDCFVILRNHYLYEDLEAMVTVSNEGEYRLIVPKLDLISIYLDVYELALKIIRLNEGYKLMNSDFYENAIVDLKVTVRLKK